MTIPKDIQEGIQLMICLWAYHHYNRGAQDRAQESIQVLGLAYRPDIRIVEATTALNKKARLENRDLVIGGRTVYQLVNSVIPPLVCEDQQYRIGDALEYRRSLLSGISTRTKQLASILYEQRLLIATLAHLTEI